MIEVSEILQTIRMVSEQHFDIRTITMGISLLDCKKNTDRETAQAVYDKVTRLARDLVRVGGELESELGVPIVNKRISVTPVGMICGDDPVAIAMALDEAAGTVGVNFIGGYSARSCTRALTRAEETLLRLHAGGLLQNRRACCGSVNVGSTRSRHQHGRRAHDGPGHQARPPSCTADTGRLRLRQARGLLPTPWRTTPSWPARSTAWASRTA